MKYYGGDFNFQKLFSGSDGYEVTLASKNLPVSTETPDTIGIDQMVELRKMLEEEQYESLIMRKHILRDRAHIIITKI
jgi:hypothetical protein